MLELRKDGITIPIPADLEVNREFETTIFNRDSDAADFTLPIDLPLTDDLIRILNMPHILANPNVLQEYDFDLIIDGIYVNKVILRVLRTKLRQKTCSVSIIGNYGSFAKVAGDIKVNDLILGGVRTIGFTTGIPEHLLTWSAWGNNSPLYYQGVTTAAAMASANANNDKDYLFPTCMDEKQNLQYGHTSLKDDDPVRSIINAWDYTTQSFINPVKHYIHSVWDNTFWSSERHYWVPMFRMGYVLRRCFEELGFTVSGSVFQDGNFMNILLYNTYAINKVFYQFITNPAPFPGTVTINDYSVLVDPKNHVPRWTIVDFIAEVSKNYNLQYVIDWNNKSVAVNMLKTLSGTNKDLSLIAFPDPEINFEKTEFMRGYDLSFEWDPADDASGADIKEDVASLNYIGAVNNVADLANLAPAAYDIAYVRNLNAYYQYGGTDWFFYSNNLDRYKTSTQDQLQTLNTRAVPMALKYIDYSLQHTTAGVSRVEVKEEVIGPVSEMGMECEHWMGMDLEYLGNNAPAGSTYADLFKLDTSKLSDPPQPHLIQYNGLQDHLTATGFTDYYPMASSVPYACKGTSLPGYGQCWNNPDSRGLYPDWWKDFIDRLSNALQVDYRVLMNSLTYNSVDLNTDVIVIDSLRYLCRKANIPMPFPAIATLTLVRI